VHLRRRARAPGEDEEGEAQGPDHGAVGYQVRGTSPARDGHRPSSIPNAACSPPSGQVS
jgi:hypothetical protein